MVETLASAAIKEKLEGLKGANLILSQLVCASRTKAKKSHIIFFLSFTSFLPSSILFPFFFFLLLLFLLSEEKLGKFGSTFSRTSVYKNQWKMGGGYRWVEENERKKKKETYVSLILRWVKLRGRWAGSWPNALSVLSVASI